MNPKLKYILSCSGKNHYFDIAKILSNRNQLSKIICGYPWFKIRKYNINKEYVSANGLYRILREPLISQKKFKRIDDYLNNLNSKNIDKITSNHINKIDNADVLIGFAGVSLNSGKLMRERKKIYICDSTSAHIQEQSNILAEEYKEFLNKKFSIDQKVIDYKIGEYENANFILTPSSFVKKSFEKFNFSNIKILELAADTSLFYPINEIKKNKNTFDIIFIGNISVRKGLHYLIKAFNNFKHPNKKLHIVGSQTGDKDFFYDMIKDERIVVYGHVSQEKLNKIINKCKVNVLPSIEDGFGLVVPQTAAAGCPSIVSENAGASDIVKKNKSGFSITARNSSSITEKLQLLADDKNLLNEMSQNALNNSKINSWENYVTKLNEIVDHL
jgi:alpha-maltose-1-phosphate synthase